MDFLMPKLSDTMEEGTVLQWLKQDGDEVAKGEPLVEIETDKANMMVEAPDSGQLQIVAQIGDSLPIGATIATIGSGAAAAAQPTPDSPPAEAHADDAADEETEDAASGDETTGIPTADDGTGSSIGLEVRPPEAYPGAADDDDPQPATAAPPPVAAQQAPSPAGDQVRASPLARRLAEELGVDLSTVQGTGPAGRVVREDVEAAAAAVSSPTPAQPAAAPQAPAPTTPPTATPGERVALTRLQRTVAKRMAATSGKK